MKVRLSSGKIVDVQPAKGVEGILCCSSDNRWFFRVYETGDKSQFSDYDLVHDDLLVKIDPDEMASFYDDGENQWLDHSPEVFGLEIIEE